MQQLPFPRSRSAYLLEKCRGKAVAPSRGMHDLSPKRKRTLALHDRALRFSNAVNISCPNDFSNLPSRRVWDQRVRAADGSSNNLIEADDASSDADFLSKMGIALREMKESRAALIKIRMGSLDHHQLVVDRGLESEAGELAAVYAAIIRNMRIRLEREAEERKNQRARRN